MFVLEKYRKGELQQVEQRVFLDGDVKLRHSKLGLLLSFVCMAPPPPHQLRSATNGATFCI